ncbi:hypothetical protein K2173_024770 [Erythroxylum novogranatense]|uniref:Uncharacterized protein n=1 Tax=Erythroxylum novogranatense TaxID=1862640 RepID=A0AAV8SVH9_9ROSI|nr:hypothetical protein K2173_024770 [Erythroxylum novogranatense]
MAEFKLQVHNSNSRLLKAPSKKKGYSGFTNKCACLVKEQRARIYILRRCATLLLCWHIHGDD